MLCADLLSSFEQGAGATLLSVHGFLIAGASLAVEHVLWVTQALVVVACGLSCLTDQRTNLCPLRGQVDS